jgi:hypothetical protein
MAVSGWRFRALLKTKPPSLESESALRKNRRNAKALSDCLSRTHQHGAKVGHAARPLPTSARLRLLVSA